MIAEGQADENGNFAIPVSAEDVVPLEQIQLIAYDENGVASAPTAAIIP